jgi:CelD/BcsL family acetyltransferase involved in cellulose biosynthesis
MASATVVDVISDRRSLGAYESEWRELAERRSNAFITPEWFSAALQHYGESIEPAVFATRRADGSLLGLMPLVLSTSGRTRTLRFAGAAQADYLHPACAREDEETLARAAASTIADAGSAWTLAVLDNVSAAAPWWRTFARAPGIVGVVGSRDNVLPGIELGADGWQSYLVDRGRNFRDQAGRYPRRIERRYRVRYRRTVHESELDSDMATLFRLHDARWSRRGGSSLTSEQARRFQTDFARSALKRGWLRLWFLELDDSPVAAWYGWRIGSRYAYYQAGFDPAFAKLGVGFVLMVHTVRSALEEGASYYDMLLGDEDYKARFTNAAEPVRTVSLSRSPSAHFATAAEAAIWRGSRRLPVSIRSVARPITSLLPTARRR